MPDNRRNDSKALPWGTRPNGTNDHGIRGGTRPVATQPPTKPPRGGSAVQNPPSQGGAAPSKGSKD
jgi:hypothetical protein